PGPALRRAIADARPDLVHTNNLPGISSAVWESARQAGVPIVHTLHDYHLLCPRTTLVRRDGAPCRPHPLLCGVRTSRLRRFAGDGPLRPELAAAAARGSLGYDGFLDGSRKLDFLAACDVGLVPSLWDEPSGPPYVVCEWLAAGRPVLATPRGGLAEAVE